MIGNYLYRCEYVGDRFLISGVIAVRMGNDQRIQCPYSLCLKECNYIIFLEGFPVSIRISLLRNGPRTRMESPCPTLMNDSSANG